MKAALGQDILVNARQQALAAGSKVKKTRGFPKDLLFVITDIPSKIKTYPYTNDEVDVYVCNTKNVTCLYVKSYVKHSLQKRAVRLLCCDQREHINSFTTGRNWTVSVHNNHPKI